MKNKQRQELAVCGFEAVKALGRVHPDSVMRLFFTAERSRSFGNLCRTLAGRGAPYNTVDAADLEKLCGSVHHQGVVAMIASPSLCPLTSDKAISWVRAKERILLLDHVGNANNFGAIVRSAAYFGIRRIVLSLDEGQSVITTSAYRVAQGGMEYTDIYTVRSPSAFLQHMDGKMVRIAADVRGDKPVSAISSLCEKRAAVVVLGNEENGISRDILNMCDHHIIIPGIPSAGNGDSMPAVESLNVAQAAAVVCYEYSRQAGA